MTLRVLHVQDHTIPEMSGYAIRSQYMAETEMRMGIELEVVSSARHKNFSALVEEPLGFKIHRTPWPEGAASTLQLKIPFWRERLLTRALFRRIVEAGTAFRPHVIHAHSPIFNGQAALKAARVLGVPVIYEIRAFWEDDAVDKRKFAQDSFVYRQVRRIETGVCQRADLIVTICDGLKEDLVGRGLSEEKVLVVQNGVDGDRFRPEPEDSALRTSLGLTGSTVAGFVGSFLNYEGLPLLVEAVSLLKQDHPELKALLVGAGEDEERIRSRIADLGLEESVVLTGRVPHEEVARHYGVMDVMVYPRLSLRITELVTPLKPLEAFALEKTAIGSDVGGIRELFESCSVGHVFKAGSADDLARVLGDWLAKDAGERGAEAERARQAILERRDWAKLLQPLLAAYETLGRRPSAPVA